MKMSMSILLVMMDTLSGSLSIHDRGLLFKYSEGTREKAFREIEKQLNAIEVDMTLTDS